MEAETSQTGGGLVYHATDFAAKSSLSCIFTLFLIVFATYVLLFREHFRLLYGLSLPAKYENFIRRAEAKIFRVKSGTHYQ
jgi:hypothetical protein